MACDVNFNDGLILPNLLTQLRNILDQYPDNGQILKELIQNAEDAEARRICFMLDTTLYDDDSSKLLAEGLDKFQGPALLAFNDAVFSECDWNGIRMISDSIKRHNPLKVGRFGLGFKSVFHLTDLPSILSGYWLAFIDPHEEYFKSVMQGSKRRKVRTSSFMYDLRNNADFEKMIPHLQAHCHEVFGLNLEQIRETRYCEGTVMRFPLRNKEMARTSDLSGTVYTEERVLELFEALHAEMHLNLLFLSTLEEMQVYYVHGTEVQKQYEVFSSHAEGSRDLESRLSFFQAVKKDVEETTSSANRPVFTHYPTCVCVTNYLVSDTRTNKYHFLVCQYLAKSHNVPSKFALPWVSVAVPMDHADGHVFCFLPLPIHQSNVTGLNFHINGFFSVDQNRQHLKMPSESQGMTDVDIQWNNYLLQDLIPAAVSSLICHIKQINHMTLQDRWKTILKLLPDKKQILPYYQLMICPLCELLKTESILLSMVDDGKWLKWSEAVFCDGSCSQMAILKKVLLASKCKLVEQLNPSIYDTMEVAGFGEPQRVTPRLVAEEFKRVQYSLNMGNEERIAVLEYIISCGNYEGLELVPLKDGSFGKFCKASGTPFFIDAGGFAERILPKLGESFVKLDQLSDTCKQKLCQLAQLDNSQLLIFYPEQFPVLLKEMTTSQPPTDHDYPLGWLESVWHYIQEHKIKVTEFDGVPIVETSSGFLTLSSSTPILLCSFQGYPSLPNELVSILKYLGITVADTVPSYLEECTLPFFEGFICKPGVRGILKAMLPSIENDPVRAVLIDKMSSLSRNEVEVLRNFLSDHFSELTEKAHLDMIRLLPIFPLVKGRGYSSASETDLAMDGSQISYGLETGILDAADKKNMRLLQCLSVSILSVTDIMIDFVLETLKNCPSFYTCDEELAIEEDILTILSTRATKNECLIEKLKKVPFMLSRDGKRVFAHTLFNPHDDVGLNDLLECEQLPSESACREQFKEALFKLGLRKSSTLTHDECLQVASSVHNADKKQQKAQLFCRFLEKNVSVLSQKLHSDLQDLSWVPVMTQAPHQYSEDLPFLGKSCIDGVSCPLRVTSAMFCHLTGSTQYLVPESAFPNLTRFFGWDKAPNTKSILEHLKVIRDKSVDAQKLYPDIVEIYGILSKRDPQHIKALLSELSFDEWVYYGSGFTDIQHIALEEPQFQMEPHVYAIPSNIGRRFASFFGSLGVIDTPDMNSVLCMIACAQGKQNSNRLGNKDLRIVIDILRVMAESGLPPRDNILVPVESKDNDLKLVEKSLCASTDSTDTFGLFDALIDQEVYFIHEDVPPAVVSWLNLPSLISRFVDADELDMSYGQEESLTRRLRTLLADYSDGLSIIKELIQNADDAGASEIRFLYDERRNENSKDRLFDKGMQEVQGPALWAYNDACFTDEDFDNIVKLSGATKKSNTKTIGQFGLGFNAVYNLTDVPSFVSRSKMVIFDPHLTHLGKIVSDKTRPGIKIDALQSRRMVEHFADQFKPFELVYGCELFAKRQEFNGTLFRLPLRTRAQAIESEICKKPYQKHDVMELFNMLADCSETVLLFTQNVSKITVDYLPHHAVDGSSFESWFTINKTHTRNVRSGGGNILQMASDQMLSGQVPDLALSDLFEIQVNCCEDIEIKFDKLQPCVSTWYVGHAMGSGESFNLAKQNAGLLPVAGIASKITFQEARVQFMPLDSGLLFCFLPLPVSTGLPVHVNGCFAVSSSRRNLHTSDIHDRDSSQVKWNTMLAKDALVLAYTNFLVDLGVLIPDTSLSNTYNLWPRIDKKQSDIVSWFIPSYCSYICQIGGPKIFPATVSLVPYSSIVTLNRKDYFGIGDDIILTMLRVLCSVFSRKDLTVVDIPMKIQTMLLEAGIAPDASKFLSRHKFFEEIFLKNISNMELKDRDELIIHFLTNEQCDEILLLFKKHLCIPVLPCGSVLKRPASLIHPSSKIAKLYDEQEGIFPSLVFKNQTQKNAVYRSLVRLGMAIEKLPWKQIADRCRKISCQSVSNQKLYANMLIRLMDNHLNNSSLPSQEEKNDILTAPFLQVMQKPKIWNKVPWKGAEYTELLAPNNLFHPKHKELIGCVKPLVVSSVCPAVLQFLEIDDRSVSCEDALHQLMAVCECEVSDDSIDVITDICRNIYRFFDEQLRNIGHLSDEIKCWLQNSKCILHGNQFVTASNCALSGKEYVPLLFIVEQQFRKSKTFLKAIGTKKSFHPEDYMRALSDVNTFHPAGGVVEEQLLRVVTDIVKHLAEVVSEECIEIAPLLQLQGKLFLPNANCRMSDSQLLCYDNCRWAEEDKEKICHPSISQLHAERLGLRTIRQQIVKRSRIGRPFGQKEALVARINRILSVYPVEDSILKELLQNADDAGASELHFILDWRKHPSKTIFNDEWASLNGPALCVYNNKPFTLDDIEGIQRLGEGSKSDDLKKTGQFGVGFNCVYHFTDVPTFLTNVQGQGKVLIAFDPNCKYVPYADVTDPGGMFDMNPTIEAQFKDVARPYMQENYDVDGGTMFRFPLRTSEHETHSEIKALAISPNDVRKLMMSFTEELFEVLIFLKNVSCVVLKEIDHNGKHIEIDTYNRSTVKSFISDFHDMPHVSTGAEVNVKSNTSGISKKWIVVQHNDFDDPCKIPHKLINQCKMERLNYLPAGGVALPLEHEAKQRSKVFFTLPLPVDTPLPVHVDGHFALDHESRRGLWHSEYQDTRTQWNKQIMICIVAKAYANAILCARKYVDAADAKSVEWYLQMFPRAKLGDKYFDLVQSLYSSLLRMKIFPALNFEKMEVFWVSASEGYYDTHFQWPPALNNSTKQGFQSTSLQTNKSWNYRVREILWRLGMYVYGAEGFIVSLFEQVGLNTRKLSPENCLECCRNHADICPSAVSVRNSFLVDIGTASAFVQYCSSAERFLYRLEGTPLCITSDSKVRVFSSLHPVYMPDIKHLIPRCTDAVLHEMFRFKVNPHSEVNYIKQLCPQSFAQFLPRELPVAVFKGKFKKVPLNDLVKMNKQEWLKAVWIFICNSMHNSGKEKGVVRARWCLDSLSDWCLLPAVQGTKKILLPACKAECVFYDKMYCDTENYEAKEVLNKCNLYKLDEQLAEIIKLPRNHPLSNLLATVDEPCNVVKAFQEVMLEESWTFPRLPKSQTKRLVEYFGKHAGSLWSVTNDVLRALPLYENVAGSFVQLLSGCVYVIPNIPMKDMDIWSSIRNEFVIFLKENEDLKALHRYLDCHIMTAREVYLDYIFLHLELLSDEGRKVHLKYVKNNLLPDEDSQLHSQEDTKFLKTLQNLKFLRSKDGSLCSASDCYSHKVDLFVKMEEQLVENQFRDDYWFSFLCLCGLKTEVLAEKVTSYANSIAWHAVSDPQNDLFHKQARALVSHITDEKYPIAVYRSLKQIKFLPALRVDRGLHTISPQFGMDKPFIHFEGSYRASETKFVWTQHSVLPPWCTELASINTDDLAVPDEPDTYVVVSHLKKVCETITPSSLQKKLATKLFVSIFDKLSKKPDLSFANGLQDVRCVPVDLGSEIILVKPSQIVIDLRDEIQPYLVGLPYCLRECEQVLLAVGACKSCNPQVYAAVLQMVFDETGTTECMGPNMRAAVFKCLECLFRHCKDLIQIDISHLFLPCKNSGDISDDWKMLNASSLLYKDFEKWDQRLTYLKKSYFSGADCGIDVGAETIKRVFQNMPREVAPQLLSRVLSEVLIESSDAVKPDDHYACRLVYPGFHSAVRSIIEYCKKEEQTAEEIAKVIASIKIGRQASIQTYLSYNGKKIKGSESSVPFFSLRKDDETIILLQDSCKGNEVVQSICDALLGIMNIENVKSNVTRALEGIIQCDESEIPSVLEKHNISVRGSLIQGLLPILGGRIPEQMRIVLVESKGKFTPKEYVAMKISTASATGKKQMREGDFVFCQVMEEASDSESCKHKVKVSNSEFCVVENKLLFQFQPK